MMNNMKNKGIERGLAIMYGGVFLSVFFIFLIMEFDLNKKLEFILSFLQRLDF